MRATIGVLCAGRARSERGDIATAGETVRRITELNQKAERVLVILAHDHEQAGNVPFFPRGLTTWALQEIAKRREEKSAAVKLCAPGEFLPGS